MKPRPLLLQISNFSDATQVMDDSPNEGSLTCVGPEIRDHTSPPSQAASTTNRTHTSHTSCARTRCVRENIRISFDPASDQPLHLSLFSKASHPSITHPSNPHQKKKHPQPQTYMIPRYSIFTPYKTHTPPICRERKPQKRKRKTSQRPLSFCFQKTSRSLSREANLFGEAREGGRHSNLSGWGAESCATQP